MSASPAHFEPEAGASALLRTLLLCDLVGSTALVEKLGDRAAAELIRKHDRMARTVADRHGGREIDKTDGFLMMFDRPIQAVAFALDYQRGLRQLNAAEQSSLAARVGIHVGDVVVWDNTPEDVAKGAKLVEVEGLVKPVASRLMNLALPGQILLSNIAHALAHRAQGELGMQLERVRWRTYGRYRFKGIPDPIPVFEVGEDGVAPLKAPPWSGKAYREIPFWRRPAMLAAEAVALVAFVAIPAFVIFRPAPAIAFADRDWVVVGNLNNLTREPVFDDTLQGAMRIALEQSRYVNVLPDLKVRDTVKRMERDPVTTRIDRAIGSEIAIRDGAKALILPTVAEVGGRVRVTAEVIDPHTQTTVYSESADGIGAESVLPSLDLVNQRLRVRLGEALATVTQESRPLEKVATKNLDALRMYSKAEAVIATGDFTTGLQLYRSAIELDPEFSLARMELASRLISSEGKKAEGREQLRRAMANPERLSTRDKLLGEALLSDFESPGKALLHWRALAELYPDLFRAQGAYGYYAWHYANDYDKALMATRRNAVDRNPRPGIGHYLLGTLLLGTEEYAEALKQFELSEAAGLKLQNHLYATAYAVQRRYDEIDGILAKGRSAPSPSPRDGRLFDIAYAADRGEWKRLESLAAAAAGPSSGSSTGKLVDSDVQLVMRLLLTRPGDRTSLVGKLDPKLIDEVRNADDHDPKAVDAHILFRAWMAARYGSVDVARSMLGSASERASDDDYPALRKVRDLVLAEIDRRSDNGSAAIARLRDAADGTELYASRVVLMEALSDAKDARGTCEQARWLSGHRGRAYTEVAGGPMFVPFNVAQSNIATLALAECSIDLGKIDEARRALATFQAAWKVDAMPEWIRERVLAARQRIDPPQPSVAAR